MANSFWVSKLTHWRLHFFKKKLFWFSHLAQKLAAQQRYWFNCFINRLGNTYIWSMHFELAVSKTDRSGYTNYTEVFCIFPSNFSLGLFPVVTFPLSAFNSIFFIIWHACVSLPGPLPLNFPLLGAINWFQMLWFMNCVQN